MHLRFNGVPPRLRASSRRKRVMNKPNRFEVKRMIDTGELERKLRELHEARIPDNTKQISAEALPDSNT